MSDDTDGRFGLSRRKTLASIGTIGVATAGLGAGTMAQFTDTEEGSVSFSAGQIDGRVRAGASYNGEDLQTFDGNGFSTLEDGIGLDVELADIKPGDHGCFSFGIEVVNNPAWVAACLAVEGSTDGSVSEPEVDADGDLNASQIGSTASSPGEIPENMLVIPFYGGQMPPSEPFDPCVFFDPELEEFHVENYQGSGAVGTTTDFWDNSEGGLTPATLAEAVQLQAIDTVAWEGGGADIETYDIGDSIAIGEGCVFLNGALNTSNQKAAAPVEPGSEFRFGWDWHVPFDVGNVMQGDEMTLKLGFVFGQTRHTESAQLSNVFAPQQNLP